MNELILRIGDFLFGWLLLFPRDVTLLVISIGSSAILTVVRRWTTNQDLLGRCADDKRTIARLVREAKRAENREALQRLRATSAQIGLLQLRQEGRPLIAAILPLALLATWAFFRLEYHPIRAGEPVAVAAYFPVSAAGRVTHLLPQPGLAAPEGWIQRITPVTDQGPPYGVARWSLRAEAASEPYLLTFRFGAGTYRHPLRAGGHTYEPPLLTHGDVLRVSEVQLRQYKPFGFVPGIRALALAPWLVGYLLIVIPFVTVCRRVLRIH